MGINTRRAVVRLLSSAPSRGIPACIATGGWSRAKKGVGGALDMAYLGKVFADSLRSSAEIVTEGTGVTCLTSALAEELAGNMRGVWRRLADQHRLTVREQRKVKGVG
jgi:hypothetical protein